MKNLLTTEMEKEIKVLHIITLFTVGGATENTLFTVAGLIKKGYKVDIITGSSKNDEGGMFKLAEELNVPVFTFRNLQRPISLVNDIKIIIDLYKHIKKNKYHIVHTHSAKAGVVGRIAAWLSKTPIIIHHNHGKPYHRFQSFWLRNSYKLIEKFASHFCDKIVSVTNTIVNEMSQDKIAPKEKFVVIRSGFDISMFKNYDFTKTSEIRKKYNVDEDDILIGKIARFSELKGHIFLLNAFEKVIKQKPNSKLILIGDGECKSTLMKFIDEKKLNDKIVFTGMIWPNEIPSIISILDVVVHTSLLEGLPRVFVQSLLMGKPVISFDLDGAAEVIEDGKNGYLVEPKNTEMLADRILDLIVNPSKAKSFGDYAKNNIREDFSIEAMVENNNKLYLELISKKLKSKN
ncbi:MAG: glycosyltransferase family 4 protein [Melioribacteraceae bacterium]|nr:glycosyltransferase family 4 protein [Melioribacteraceae bacterium]